VLYAVSTANLLVIVFDYILITLFTVKIWLHLRGAFSLTTVASAECQHRFHLLNVQVTV
jgi:hypothetical protein